MSGRENPSLVRSGALAAPFLAHEGGWDEILLVGGPLAVIALLLWIANRRVAAKLAEQDEETQTNA